MGFTRFTSALWNRLATWREIFRRHPKLKWSLASLAASLIGLLFGGVGGQVWTICWAGVAAALFALDLLDQASRHMFRAAPALPDTRYAPPYDSWTKLSDGRRELVTSPEFNRTLWEETVPIPFVEQAKWRISDRDVEEDRLRWAAANRNDAKIRLASDPDPANPGAPLQLQRTDYASFVVTNRLAYEEIVSKRSHRTARQFDDFDDDQRFPPLSLSQSSNHIGGDLLLVAPNGMVFLQQGQGNGIYPNHWVASSSGSFDYPIDMAGATDLREIVKTGLTRELREEAGLPKGFELAATDVKVVGFGRATYFGGKPQFFGVARTAKLVHPRIVGEEGRRKYAKAHRLVSVSLDAGAAGIIRSLDRFLATYDTVSPSLWAHIQMIKCWLAEDPDGDGWLLHYLLDQEVTPSGVSGTAKPELNAQPDGRTPPPSARAPTPSRLRDRRP